MKTFTILLVVQGLSLVACIPRDVSFEDVRAGQTTKPEATAFVRAQFDNWMGAKNCTAFADSFTEPFAYCDATDGCLTTKAELMALCNKVAKLTGEVHSLEVKPLWSPAPDFNSIAITGKQSLSLLGNPVACFDFAIIEELNRTNSGDLTSHLWRGYYTIGLGDCDSNDLEPSCSK
jgi:hypothetical protein